MSIPLERYMAYNVLYNFSANPADDIIAVSTNTSGQVNIWLYNTLGLSRRVTTFTDHRAMPISWSPNGDKLLFGVDYKGNEIWQLYLYREEDKWYREIVVEDNVVHYSSKYSWNPGGKGEFIYFANPEDPGRFDLYLYSIEENGSRLLWEGLGGYQIPFWYFPDRIIIQDIRSHEDTTLYLLDMSKMDIIELTPHEGEAIFQPISPYNDGFFLISDWKKNYKYLAYYNLEKRTMKIIWSTDYDVENAALSEDYLGFTINVDSYSKLYIMDLETKKSKRIFVPDGVIDGIDPGRGNTFFLMMSTPYRPTEIYVYEVDNDSFKRVTNNFYGEISRKHMSEPRVEYYKSFDALKIHTLIYKPRGEGKFPVLIYLHGGPQSQSRPRYSPLIQYMISRGVAVVLPNFRGSTGFGKEFSNLINRDWGGGELRDIEYLIKYLSKKNWVDKDRIGIFGGSFGGFLTLSCITRIPDAWKVAVEWFGPSNLVTFVKTVPPYWKRYMKKWVGDPEDPEDLKMLEERSPIKYIDNIKIPLMVVQGAKDIRVVKNESEQLVNNLRMKGLEVEYIIYDDEGHGFTKEENLKDAIRKTVDFLLRHLLQ
jgi:dipeptidyl aminopeptidase/acylaminoacyl peptidase